MTIKEVSKKYGISTDTLRYYERIGLFPRVKRTAGGMRDCGVQIAPLTRYVALALESGTEKARLDILKEQHARLTRQRADLDATLARLNKKIRHYENVLKEKK